MGIRKSPHPTLSQLRWERDLRSRSHQSPLLLAATFAAATLLAISDARADSMRCGSKLIGEGDSIDKVLQYCGEPATRERTWIQRAPVVERGRYEFSIPGREDVPVDLWTYDFGANKLMRRVRMVAGKVERIETLEYGTSR